MKALCRRRILRPPIRKYSKAELSRRKICERKTRAITLKENSRERRPQFGRGSRAEAIRYSESRARLLRFGAFAAVHDIGNHGADREAAVALVAMANVGHDPVGTNR